MARALDLGKISTRRRRIAEMARKYQDEGLQTLAHFIDIHWLYEAWKQTNKNRAVGVDGVTRAEYEENLMDNLRDLHERFKSGNYVAPPLKRAYIPKSDGTQRGIGIPSLEDKVLQKAVHMVLEIIYDQVFYDFSFAFQKGKNQHQALEKTWKTAMDFKGGWVLSVDIKGYFDTVKHSELRGFLDKRVRDGVIRRMIDKWLKAKILEEGVFHANEKGTPQGGVISPLLSNIYLHYVLDEWIVKTARPRCQGDVAVIRYADDFLIMFENKRDAEKVMSVIGERFLKYGLQLHPKKTRLIDFRQPGWNGLNPDGRKPGSFDFVGFTLHWGFSRNGNPVVRRKTAKDRLDKAIKKVGEWLKENRHKKIRLQWKELCKKIVGHYQYYGVTANIYSLKKFRHRVTRFWCYWLRRRSQRNRMTWDRFNRILKYLPIPKPKIHNSSI